MGKVQEKAGFSISKGGGGRDATAALSDFEDKMFRSSNFRKWAKKKNEANTIGPLINYDKSPAPPKK